MVFSSFVVRPSCKNKKLQITIMRIITTAALAVTVAVVVLLRCCEGASLHVSLPEDDEDFRARPMYRDYGLIRSRVVRADDVFDDYGHLRFGRSDD